MINYLTLTQKLKKFGYSQFYKEAGLYIFPAHHAGLRMRRADSGQVESRNNLLALPNHDTLKPSTIRVKNLKEALWISIKDY